VTRPEETGRRGRRLRAALAAVLVKAEEPELRLMHDWLDSWSGIGLIVVGMTRQGFQLGLDQRTGQWLALFLPRHGWPPFDDRCGDWAGPCGASVARRADEATPLPPTTEPSIVPAWTAAAFC
jgi:hypothetical protein